MNEGMFNIQNQMKKFNKENNKALRNLFRNDIKGNFLIKILEKIRLNYLDVYKYYENPLNVNIENILQGMDDKIDYDVCCHIVGVHKSNTMFLSDEQKIKLQNDLNYQNKLCKQVYEHIQLRPYGSSFFRNKQFIIGDKFLYLTMGYDMFVVSIYISSLLSDNFFSENKFVDFYLAMIREALSILTLMENGLPIESFPHCRNLIELYFKYEIIFKHPNAIDEYKKFSLYEVEYANTGTFNDEFVKKHNESIYSDKKDIINYLHFGWIDKIFDMNYLGKERQYSITGLFNYLNMLDKNNSDLAFLRDAHNRCHMHSHGSIVRNKFPLVAYFELAKVLYIILKSILVDLCECLNKKPIIKDIDIRKKIENDYKNFSDKLKQVNRNNLENYYFQTNNK